MSRVCISLVVAGLCICVAKPGFAVKAMSDVFVATYASNTATPAFQSLVKVEAKCNVCHIAPPESKKNRNPYGVALHEAMKEVKFPVADFKKISNQKDPKLVALLKEAMKKIEDQKPKNAPADAQTFGARIKEGLLPGGDKLGK